MSRRVVVHGAGFDAKAHSRASVLEVPPGPSKVQQQFKDSADINTIMRRFGVSGVLPTFAVQGVYGDFTGVSEIRDAFDLVDRANARFMALDPSIRERFRNDPRELARVARSMSEDEFYASLEAAVVPSPAPGAGAGVPAAPAVPGVVPVPGSGAVPGV